MHISTIIGDMMGTGTSGSGPTHTMTLIGRDPSGLNTTASDAEYAALTCVSSTILA